MTNQTIKIRKLQLNKLFPNQFTKMREEDFLRKAGENKGILNKREYNALVNMKGTLHDKKHKEHYEFYVKRKRDRIEMIPFD